MRRVIGLSTILMIVMMMGIAPTGAGLLGTPQGVYAASCGGTPTVTTDQVDYVPNQTVHISGSGYDCSESLTVNVTSPGGVVTTIAVTTDSNGAFTATYTIPTSGNETTFRLEVLDANGHVLTSTTFMDTHFRYGSLTWTRPNPATRTVNFILKVGYRDDYPWQCINPAVPPYGQAMVNCSGPFSGVSGRNVPAAGDYIDFNGGEGDIQFGDGTGQFFNYGLHIDSVNTTQDWFSATAYTFNGSTPQFFIPHNYGPNSTYTAFFEGCCRLSTLPSTQHDTPWQVNSLVNLVSGDPASLSSSLTPIVNCGRGSICHFFLPVADNDVPPNTVAERLSTASESQLPILPPGLSIDPATGLFSWDTRVSGADTGGPSPLPWAAQATITESNASHTATSSIAVDFLLQIINDTPPAFVSPPASPQTVLAGHTISFPVEASEASGTTDIVSIGNLGLPTGATLTCPSATRDTTCTFSWTPVPTDIGSHLVTFTATNNLGLASVPLTVTINVQSPLMITADNQMTAHGAALPSFTVSYNGFVNGDTPTTPGAVNGTLNCTTTATTDGSNRITSDVGNYPITCSGLTSNRYAITFAPGSLQVTQAQLTVKPDTISAVYGMTPTFTYTITGFAAGETASVLTAQPSCTSTGIGGHVGNSYPITCSGGAGTNYTFQYNTAQLTFTPAPLTITAKSPSITYGDSTPAIGFTYSSLQNGDTSTATPPTCSTTAPATNAAAGTYVTSCSGAVDPNYTIAYVSGMLTVNAQGSGTTLSSDSTGNASTYGDTVTFTATVNSATSGTPTGSVNFLDGTNPLASVSLTGGQAQYTTSALGAGPHTITATYVPAANGQGQNNYAASSSAPLTQTVSRAVITVQASSGSMSYGDSPPVISFSYSGFVNGDGAGVINGTPACSTTATSASSVAASPYPSTCNTSGLSAANYSFAVQAGSVSVTTRLVTVTADAQSKTYGDPDPALTYQLTSGNLVNGDTFSGALSRAVGENVGDYAIGQGNLALSGNYTLTYRGANLTIGPASLTITTDPVTRQYGASDPSFTVKLTGLTNGDTPAAITRVVCTSNDTTQSHVSGIAYTITCTSDLNPNYDITYPTATLTITPAPLTVTADNQSKAYGAPLPPLTFTTSALLNGDTAGALGPVVCGTTATAGSHVTGSPYAITCSGATDTDYSYKYADGELKVTAAPLSGKADDTSKVYGAPVPAFTATFTNLVAGDSPPAVSCTSTGNAHSHVGTYPIICTSNANTDYSATISNGTLSVTPAPLQITANDASQVYGASAPPLSASYNGLVNGDTATTSGLAVTCGTTATPASHVTGSPYPINCSGATDPDYTIGYTPGNLTVTRAPLGVKADDKSKVYGAALPALTASFTGLQNGDAPPMLSCSTSADATSHVGTYPISCSTAANADYIPTAKNGTLSVTAAALTIKADDKSKAYGAALPALTASYSGLTNGDTATTLGLAVGCGSAATSASHVAGSPYAIICSGAIDPDYTYTYGPGALTVTPAGLTVKPNDTSMVYGGAAPVFTPTYASFVNGDTASSLTTQPSCSSTGYNTGTGHSGHVVAGGYPITCSGASDSDYTIGYAPGILTVTPAPLTITADNQSGVFNDPLPALTWHANFVNGDGPSALTSAPTCSTAAATDGSGRITSAAGPYAIMCGSASPNGDYTIAGYTPGTLTVSKEDLALTYAGDTLIAQAGTAHLAAILTADSGSGDSKLVKSYTLVANSLVLTLGSQSCSPTATDANGVASCTISGVTAAPGSATVTMSFSGDSFYAPATGSAPVTIGGSLYSLDRTLAGAVSTTGNGCIAVGGMILVNSNSSSAVQSGHGCNGNSISPNPTIRPGLVTDPLAALTLPTFLGGVWKLPNGSTVPQGSCNANTQICSPGVYPVGISLSGGTYTLQPGVYILSGGGLQLAGKTTLNGTGVFLYNTSQSGACGSISLSGQAQVSLAGMTSGPYQGLALAQDRGCSTAASITGKAVLNTTGGVYLPAVQLQVTGNGFYQGTLAELIVDAVQVTGNGVVKVNHS